MSPSDPDISYFRLPRGIDRKSIGQFMTAVRDRVLRGRTFACLITTDAELQRLNRTFRRKDYATDVLSFPFVPVENGSRKLRKNAPASGRGRLNACPTVEGTAPLEAVKKSKPAGETACATDASPGRTEHLGDLAISWQRARAQARDFGHSVETEIQVLLLHGALHLAGMDHEADGGQMSRAETRWRRALGLPAGLIERVSA